MEGDESTLAALARRVDESSTPAEVLSALAMVTRRLLIERISLRWIDRQKDAAILLAVESDAPTSLKPGTRMPLAATSYADIALSGGPLRASMGEAEEDATLLARLVRAEGLVSWVTFPVLDGKAIVGLLSFSSILESLFEQQAVDFLQRLVDLAAPRLVSLVRSSDVLPSE